MPLLEVQQITAGYGGGDILKGVSVRLEEGEIVSLIGPNGAGKSTVMKTVFGLLRPRLGKVLFAEQDITGNNPDVIVRKGISYVPQTENVFPSLTVLENFEMGAYTRKGGSRAKMDQVLELFPDLKRFLRKKAGALSGGQRQMVAMGRALMLDPRILMLDEPSAGLAPKLVDLIFEKIKEVNRTGVSILMVEQNAKSALMLSDRGYVLATGQNRFEDTGKACLANEEIGKLYLGG
ncbi:MAG TPA: ABC transporter ATP-binding protein [Candidatus Bipolaricaulota bacterium]